MIKEFNEGLNKEILKEESQEIKTEEPKLPKKSGSELQNEMEQFMTENSFHSGKKFLHKSERIFEILGLHWDCKTQEIQARYNVPVYENNNVYPVMIEFSRPAVDFLDTTRFQPVKQVSAYMTEKEASLWRSRAS